ncbi:peptide/nickel transport system permease protein [[Eubacterium] yurii]|jgi:oligopeptide ABC superfamily ATP binding cassette transporter, membrane protein|nr:peptide/nickel transport system permease protein [[Eubacterium] yurii]
MKKRYLLYILPVIFILIMIVTGYRDSVKTNLSETFAPISLKHYFGTDHLGRDIFSLIVDGAVRTLATVVIASLISVSFGLILGMLGGYFGKSLEIVIVFFTDMLMIVPSFIMALIISAIFGLNPVTAGITLGITGIGTYTNQTMILTRQIKNRGFILSEKALGIPSSMIMTRHILPNIITPILAALGSTVSSIALQYASLSFIGLGADITKPDWGALLYQYRVYIIDKPLMLFFPCMAIFSLAYASFVIFDDREIVI